MKYISTFSGIEAATAAWHGLGWKPVWFSEVDAFASAVLAHHYPHVRNLGDVTKFKEWPDADVDVLVGGSPCQSFSIAGLRKGLDDPRGNLMLTFGAVAGRYRPTWVVWENVPGVLSSNGGRDFGTFLGMLGELGYGYAYRVLDAQFFGVAQRRRRVFVVGHLGDWRRAAAVLFERHSLQGNPAPSREAREVSTAGTLRRTDGGSDVDHARAGHILPVAGTLTASFGRLLGQSGQDANHGHSHLVPYTAHTLRGEGFDASEDGTGRGTPLVPVCFDTTQITNKDNRSNPKAGGPCHPLAAGAHAPAICFSAKDHGADAQYDLAPTLRAGGHAGTHANAGVMPAVAFQTCGSNINVGDISGTFGTNADRASGSAPMALQSMQVRRLTPRECERLQGFPDDYTLIPRRKKPADGPRYKALGNSMAVPVMAWIGRRIALVNEIAHIGAAA